MNRETPHWGARKLDVSKDDLSPLRISITAELPETRIFIDRLYHEFTAAGRRLHTDRIAQKRGSLPWLPVSGDGDA